MGRRRGVVFRGFEVVVGVFVVWFGILGLGFKGLGEVRG